MAHVAEIITVTLLDLPARPVGPPGVFAQLPPAPVETHVRTFPDVGVMQEHSVVVFGYFEDHICAQGLEFHFYLPELISFLGVWYLSLIHISEPTRPY